MREREGRKREGGRERGGREERERGRGDIESQYMARGLGSQT